MGTAIIAILGAAAASWLFGAVWYGVFAKPWMLAADVAVGHNGRPVNANKPLPYIISLVSAVIVAGMMRHIFVLSGIDTPFSGFVSGLGLGLFIASPWIVTNYGFVGRPFALTVIDGGYASFGSAIMGLILALFL